MFLDLVTRYWIQVALGAITSILSFLYHRTVKKIKAEREKDDMTRKGMVFILRAQILGECDKWLRLGYCPYQNRKIIDELFESYTGLGGNHTIPQMVDKVRSLPVDKPKTNKKQNGGKENEFESQTDQP